MTTVPRWPVSAVPARPGGVVVLGVPALPELFAEFDAVQGHRRRYLPETLRAACGDSGLVVEQVFWWGQWMVPLLKHQRGRSRVLGRASPRLQTYRRYLRLPPWPIPWLFRLAYVAEQRRALSGRLRLGTSLFAVGTPRTHVPGGPMTLLRRATDSPLQGWGNFGGVVPTLLNAYFDRR